GLTADEYYELLEQLAQHQQKIKDDRKAKGQDPHDKGQPGKVDGKPDVTEMSDNLKDDPFGNCGSGAGSRLDNEEGLPEDLQGAERSEAEMENLRQQAAEAIADHAKKNPGSTPGGLVRWANQTLGTPQVRWQEQLRRAGVRSMNIILGQKD